MSSSRNKTAVRGMKDRRTRLRRFAVLASLTALAFGLGYLEYLIPFDAVGIPGIKIGLANLAVLGALYWLGWPDAAAVDLVRILLMWCLFGNITSFLYSLSGGLLSLTVMIVLKRLKVFDELGVSVSGAVMHNTGQMIAAAVLTGTSMVWWYYPVLLVSAAVAGTVVGLVFRLINRRLGSRLQLQFQEQ